MKNKKKQLRKLKLHKNVISSLTNIKGGEVPGTGTEPFPTVNNAHSCAMGHNTCTTHWVSEFEPACRSENGMCGGISMEPGIACTGDGTIKINPPNDTDVFRG